MNLMLINIFVKNKVFFFCKTVNFYLINYNIFQIHEFNVKYYLLSVQYDILKGIFINTFHA